MIVFLAVKEWQPIQSVKSAFICASNEPQRTNSTRNIKRCSFLIYSSFIHHKCVPSAVVWGSPQVPRFPTLCQLSSLHTTLRTSLSPVSTVTTSRWLLRPGTAAKYCDEYVCLSVCLSARITRKPHRQTSPIYVHVAYGRGAVFWRRRCDVLCTSGFVDDVMFPHKRRQNTTSITAEIPTKF